MQQDNTLSVVFNSVLVALIPTICKWMTSIPQPVYVLLAVLCLLLSIIALLICRYKYKEKAESFIQLIQSFRWFLYSVILSVACFVCTFIYPSINVPESKQTFEFLTQKNEIDSLKVLADKGNVDAMIDLGIAYSRSYESEKAFINYSEAEKYFELAAEARSAKAYAMLAQLKYRGYGKKKSRQRALEDLVNGYQIDSCNFDIFKIMAEMNVTEQELPIVVKTEYRWMSDYFIDRIYLDHILKQFWNLCNPPVDSAQIVLFCSTKLPEIDSLAINVLNTPFKSANIISGDFTIIDIDKAKNIIALMCLYVNDHPKGFEYVKDYLDCFDGSGQLSRVLFTEKQLYSERQERIDTVLIRTEDGTIDNLLENTYYQPLGLDSYYQLALRLEQLKRTINGNLKDNEEFHNLYNNYLSLIDTFINTPAKAGPIPSLPYLHVQIRPDGWGFNIDTSLQYPYNHNF